MRLIRLSCLLVLFVAVSLARAQGEPPWRVILYHETDRFNNPAGELVVLTPHGIESRFPLPAEVYRFSQGGFADIAISPDRHYAAMVLPQSPVILMDLENQQCCTYLPMPHPDTDSILLAGFNPTGSQLAFSYIGFANRDTYETEGGLVAVDASTGGPIAEISVADLGAAIGQEFRFALPGEWTPDGVRFVPSCYGCEPPTESPWYLWNPQTAQVVQASDFYTIFGDTLPITGELALTRQNPAFPVGEQFGMFPPANVVEYHSDGVPPAFREQQLDPAAERVIYFNPNDLELRQARWILDGNAIFVPGGEQQMNGVVVFRDGSQQAFFFPSTYTFLAGTPDGFLGLDENGWVVLYQILDRQINPIPMEQFAGQVRAVFGPALGATVAQPFTTITQPASPAIAEPPVEACPGFLPSRLTPGGLARVLPDNNINLRMGPSTAAVITRVIRAGTAMTVLQGPQCDPAGIAWWEVTVDGLTGWLAEGQGDTYYIEPA